MRKNRPGEARWPAGSLLAAAPAKSAFRSLIVRDEARQYAEIRDFGQRHARIFILVHGYNASVAETDIPFAAIESQIDFKPGDGVIRFYWDGLIGKGAGIIPAWLKASEASQVVGARALRSILNQFENREVHIISHSRGASIVLSALGNPVYNPKFLAKMRASFAAWGKKQPSSLTPNPLLDRGNNLHLVMLAPAVDRIDFCDASEQPNMGKDFVCSKLRPLGTQVRSLTYTVNPDDPVLGKFFLSSKALTPTGLGYTPDVGAALKAESYAILRPYILQKPSSFHAFEDYVANPVFGQILRDAGIAAAP